MAGVNKVIIVGNLGRDPEVRYNPSGDAWCTLSVATSRSWKDKNTGERKEESEWHRCVLSGRLAEVAGEYLKSGSKAYFEGRLKTRKWTDKEGRDNYTTEIIVENMTLLDAKGQGGGERSQGGGQRQQSRAPAPAQKASGGFDDMDDSIPF